MSMNRGGDKMIYVKGRTIPEVWQDALTQLVRPSIGNRHERLRIRTEYDHSESPLSVDDTCLMCIKEPMAEPRIHKCFPGGWQDLVDYTNEIVDGSRDHLHKELGYTYHHRLTQYNGIDQLSVMIDRLKEVPHSRRMQAITWIPEVDLYEKDIPCLQSIWCRIVNRNGHDQLDMHVRFRSRDAFQGAFMNIYALTLLQKYIADQLDVPVGEYIDLSDSFHVYGNKLDIAIGNVEQMIMRDSIASGSNFMTTDELRSIWEEGTS